MTRLLLIVVVFISGCVIGQAANNTHDLNKIYPAHGRSKVDMVVMSESLSTGTEYWAAEIEREYPGAVGLLCHGGDANGEWFLAPDHFAFNDKDFNLLAPFIDPFVCLADKPIPVDVEVQRLQHQYPGRLIVLCVCNPKHHRLNIPGVVYSLDSVYVMPDRVQRKSEPDAVGNIYEFVHD